MVIAIVGKTCSGKDTVARYIEETYGFKRIVTYTTRPMRGDDRQGVSHHFISKAELAEIPAESIFSPTTIDGYEYFTLLDQFTGGDYVYIVDPKGVEDMRAAGIWCYPLYIELKESLIIARAKDRGDDIGVVANRLKDERERFDSFRDAGKYAFCIENCMPIEELKEAVDSCVKACLWFRDE